MRGARGEAGSGPRSRRAKWLGAGLPVILLLSACDSDPSGPGTLLGELRASQTELGGAVLQVAGPGIDGFSGVGGSRVFWAPMATQDSYRVIVIQEDPGDLRFQVSVQDVGNRWPSATIVSLVSGENGNLPGVHEHTVRFSREG